MEGREVLPLYPVLRLAHQIFVHRNAPGLKVGDVHVTHLRCLPIDLDVFGEMNNGRFLTLFDLGRIVLFRRMGVLPEMKRRGWYGTVAGSAIRYRRRVTVFQHLEMQSSVIGWDGKFTYLDQSLWRDGDCVAQVILRSAITTGRGIVAPRELAEALGFPQESPHLPDWVQEWSEAEAHRPWPPPRV